MKRFLGSQDVFPGLFNRWFGYDIFDQFDRFFEDNSGWASIMVPLDGSSRRIWDTFPDAGFFQGDRVGPADMEGFAGQVERMIGCDVIQFFRGAVAFFPQIMVPPVAEDPFPRFCFLNPLRYSFQAFLPGTCFTIDLLEGFGVLA